MNMNVTSIEHVNAFALAAAPHSVVVRDGAMTVRMLNAQGVVSGGGAGNNNVSLLRIMSHAGGAINRLTVGAVSGVRKEMLSGGPVVRCAWYDDGGEGGGGAATIFNQILTASVYFFLGEGKVGAKQKIPHQK